MINPSALAFSIRGAMDLLALALDLEFFGYRTMVSAIPLADLIVATAAPAAYYTERQLPAQAESRYLDLINHRNGRPSRSNNLIISLIVFGLVG